MTYLPREQTLRVLESLAVMPVVALTGMRQVGKSTFLQNEPDLAKRHYVTLDDFEQLQAAKNNPEAFLQTADLMTIDEVQRCPELLITIKKTSG